MNRPLLFFSVAVAVLSMAVNLETIRTFPSWFDEAFFANIAFNLAKGDGLILDLIPGVFEGEVYLYGPVYFYLQSFLISVFGLQDFVFRFPNLIAAYLSVLLLASVLRHNGVNWQYQALFVVAAILDVSFNRNLVSGRMDMLSVMFVLLALYLVARQPAKSKVGAYFRWLLIGGMSAAAYLTTPRALFLLPVVFVFGLSRLFLDRNVPSREGNWVGLAAMAAAAFVVPVCLWIQHVGGFQEYASLFTTQTTSQHIAPSFFRSSYDNIAIGLMIALCLFKFREVMKSALLTGLILTFIAFSLFVKEVGPYAGMIMPFVLATIVLLIAESTWKPLPLSVLAALITLPGLLLLGLRGADIYLNAECRDNSKVLAAADGAIQDLKHVVAPFKYYFLLEQENRSLVTLEYSKIDPEHLVRNANFVVADGDIPEWLSGRGFKRVGKFDCALRRVPLLPATFYARSTFDEALYRR